MPIIATTGRRYWKVRLLIGSIYFLLVVGSLTMLYPFGMMLSMSVSSNCDNMEQQLVPRYIKEKLTGGVPEALFRKYASIRYPKIEQFNRRHRSRYVDYSYGLKGRTSTGIYARFQRVRPVPFAFDDRFKRVTDDVIAFKKWYALGKDPFGVMPDGPGHLVDMKVAYQTQRSQNTLNPVLDRYVEWLKAKYGTLADLNGAYREENQSWSDVLVPYERPDLVTWLPDTRSPKVRDFLEFKEQLAEENIHFLLFPDLNYHTSFAREYNSEERYFRQTGKWINTFYELKVPPKPPAVVVPHERFRAFLEERFGSLDNYNLLAGSRFGSWDELRFPVPGKVDEGALLGLREFAAYALGQKFTPGFRRFLKNKFAKPGSFEKKYGVKAPAFGLVQPPEQPAAALLEKILGQSRRKMSSLTAEDFKAVDRFKRTDDAGKVLDYFDPSWGVKDRELREALLSELVEFAYAEFCSKEQDLWVEFVTTKCPVRYLIIKDVDRKYREFLRHKYGNDIKKLLAVYRQGLSGEDLSKVDYSSFDDIKFPGDIYPKNPDGTYFVHRPIADDVLAFLKSDFVDPLKDVTVGSVEYWWGRYLEKKYGSLEKANEAHGYRFASFDEVKFGREIPREYPQVLQDLWYEYVSKKVSLDRIELSRGNLELFQGFLRDARYNGVIEDLNKAWETSYGDFDEVDFPGADWSDAARKDARAFLAHREMNPYEVFVSAPEDLASGFHDFLREKFSDVEALNDACAPYKSFDNPRIPYDEMEWRDFNEHWIGKEHIFWRFLLGNYRVVVDFLTLHGRALFNTFVFCLASILIHTTINPMCAYALSRFRLSYGHYILLFLLATMSFPPMVTMIPNFLMLKSLGLLNTYWALVLPGAANGYSIFLLKGFFDSLPQELFEAGIIDGASEVQMFYLLAMPLSYPILAVISLWAFTGAYGAFMFAFIVCQDPKLWTLMVFLYEFQQEHATQLTMAALSLASLPTLLVFILAQRVILKGIVIPQMK